MVLFQVNAVYDRQTGEDNPGKVKEIYLVEALDCADAQQQVIENIKPFIFGECDIPQVRKRRFFDTFPGDGENWYEAKVEMITIDGDKESRKAVKVLVQDNTIDGDKESRKAVKVLVQDNTIDGALKELHYKHLANFDCEILSIAKSPVLDILRQEKGE